MSEFHPLSLTLITPRYVVLREVTEDPARLMNYINDPEVGPFLLQIIRQAGGPGPR